MSIRLFLKSLEFHMMNGISDYYFARYGAQNQHKIRRRAMPDANQFKAYGLIHHF